MAAPEVVPRGVVGATSVARSVGVPTAMWPTTSADHGEEGFDVLFHVMLLKVPKCDEYRFEGGYAAFQSSAVEVLRGQTPGLPSGFPQGFRKLVKVAIRPVQAAEAAVANHASRPRIRMQRASTGAQVAYSRIF